MRQVSKPSFLHQMTRSLHGWKYSSAVLVGVLMLLVHVLAHGRGQADGGPAGINNNTSKHPWSAVVHNDGYFTLWTLCVVAVASLAVYYMFWTDSGGADQYDGNSSSGGFYSRWSYSYHVPTDEIGEPVECGTVGLANLGNSCYMSASLQCMNSVFSLRQLFLDENCENKINEDNALGSGGQVVRHFRDLLLRVWSDKISVVAPVKFKTMVGGLNNDFGGREQQDASEFMTWLLDQLHEDLNDARRGKPAPIRVRGVSFDALNNEQRAERSDEEYFLRNRSPIIDMFFGQQSSSLTWYLDHPIDC